MKIDFNNVKDLYHNGVSAVAKGPNKFFCITCKKTLDVKNFFKTPRIDKHPLGVLPECKSCISMLIDDMDPSTFLPILKEVDAPYVPKEWRKQLQKKDAKSGSIIGKYISVTKLNQYKNKHWLDSEALVEADNQALLETFRQQSESETEAEKMLDEFLSFGDITAPTPMKAMTQEPSPQAVYGLTPETSKFNLTQEEIDELRLNWGKDYNEDQYLQLEQQFTDMKEAYIIQDPLAVSNARIICKMTMKINYLLDIDDIESVTKLSRQLDLFIKSANLAPVQQKDRQQTTFAISQLAFLVEREGGFIPEFYISEPNDKIDQILADMQDYTAYLVRGESNIAEMVEHTEEILAQDELPDAIEDYDDFAALEAEILGDFANIEESQEEE